MGVTPAPKDSPAPKVSKDSEGLKDTGVTQDWKVLQEEKGLRGEKVLQDAKDLRVLVGGGVLQVNLALRVPSVLSANPAPQARVVDTGWMA
ncbi:hypothetical protein PG990_008808 [Apiospora arundinis]